MCPTPGARAAQPVGHCSRPAKAVRTPPGVPTWHSNERAARKPEAHVCDTWRKRRGSGLLLLFERSEAPHGAAWLERTGCVRRSGPSCGTSTGGWGSRSPAERLVRFGRGPAIPAFRARSEALRLSRDPDRGSGTGHSRAHLQ